MLRSSVAPVALRRGARALVSVGFSCPSFPTTEADR